MAQVSPPFRAASLLFFFVFLSSLCVVDLGLWLPSTSEALRIVEVTLSHDSRNPWCEVCGIVLELLDEMYLSSLNPFFGAHVSKTASSNTISTIESCEVDPNQALCDTFWERQRNEFRAVAQDILNQLDMRLSTCTGNTCTTAGNSPERIVTIVQEFVKNNEEMLISYLADKKKSFSSGDSFGIVTAQHSSQSSLHLTDRGIYGGRQKKCEDCYVYSTAGVLSPATVSHMDEVYLTKIWYLRQPLNSIHYDYCYDSCEGSLSTENKLRVLLWRWYGSQNVAGRVQEAQRFFKGIAGLFFLFVPMLIICLYRYSIPPPWRPSGKLSGGVCVGRPNASTSQSNGHSTSLASVSKSRPKGKRR